MAITPSQLATLRDATLTAGSRRLLLWLMSKADSRGIAVVLPRDLLSEVALSPDGLATLLDELTDAGLVSELPSCKIAQCQYRVLRLSIPE